MDIFKYAMKMEKDGEEYYRELAGKSTDTTVIKILNMLADDEVKHYNILEKMAKDQRSDMDATNILLDSKNVFEELKEIEKDLAPQTDFISMLEKAREIEKLSQDFYMEKAEDITDKEQKVTLLEIVDEEEKHYFLIDNLIAFLSRPKEWVENAEFNRLEEY